MLEHRKRGLPPVVRDDSRLLILGSLPGDESLQKEQYYANARNQFWSILADCFGLDRNATYQDRLQCLHRNRIALWDVLESAERSGSGDAAIRNVIPNELTELFRSHRELRFVGLNGGKAATLFQKLKPCQAEVQTHPVVVLTLPSTSPTPGRNVLSYPEKVVRWRDLFIEAGVLPVTRI